MRCPATIFVASIVTALTAESPTLAQGGPNAFTFIGWGDAPYVLPRDYAKVDRLIAAMNKAKPAFSIHVGDTKASNVPCTDQILKKAFDQIQTAEQPVVYSVGDNEWTDCHRKNAGGFDPRERLAKMRQMYFPAPGMSLGRNPMKVESQAKLDPKFAKFVENQRFVKNGVVFVIPHVVGSNNGLEARDQKAAEEFFERDAANIAWIEAGFDLAVDVDAKAIVIAFQANPYDTRRSAGTSIPPSSGFYNTLRAISAGGQVFGKPVLVMHGDHHSLELEGFRDHQLKLVPNVLRLQLWGEHKVHGMRVIVDPDMPGVFSFAPLIVPENGAF